MMMKNAVKKRLAGLLVFTMCLGFVPLPAFAAETGEKLYEPGTYRVTANLFVPGELNEQLPGVAVYLTNPNNPPGIDGGEAEIPNEPVADNGTLVIGEDGSKTLTLDVVNPVFTLQEIGDGTTAHVESTTRDERVYSAQDESVTHQVYGTQDDSVSRHGRITQIVATLDNDSGAYTFSDCVVFPTLAGEDWTAPLNLEVDFSHIPLKTQADEVDKPKAASGLVYTGREQTGVFSGEIYELSGTVSATDAGDYTATATLQEGYTWSDGSRDLVEITWSIAKADLTATYKGEKIALGETPQLAVEVTGFVDGDTAETAAGYKVPAVTAPGSIEDGKSYILTPAGGEAANYTFIYVAGSLIVGLAALEPGTYPPVLAAGSGATQYEPGTYTVTANLFIPGGSNPQLPGVTAYMTNPNNPLGIGGHTGIPNTPVADNATLVIGADGTKTLTVDVVNPVFTLQQIEDGENVHVQDTTRDDEVYSGGSITYNGRITQIVVTLDDDSGIYTFSDCVEFPTILSMLLTVPLKLSVDFSHIPLKTQEGEVHKPQAASGLVYTGREQTGVASREGYELSGTVSATDAGEYTVTATLQEGYTWSDGGTDPIEITWSITKAGLTATYKGETIALSGTPALAVEVAGFVNGETAETAAGYQAPTVTAPETMESGKIYTLTPAGGEAANYTFTYVSGNLTVDTPVVALEPGIYTVTANLLIPGDKNVFIEGLTVYMTSNAFPPVVPAEHNAEMVVGSDGKVILTIPLMTGAAEIFTLQNIESGPGVKVIEAKRGVGPNQTGYGECPDRIQELTVELENTSGEYQFTNCEEYPTIMSQYAEMPVILRVDFSSAENPGYMAPGEGQPSWEKTYTDETTGAIVTVTTTEESIGARLGGAFLSVTKTVGGERYDALQQALNEMYSTNPGSFDLYTIALTDSNGDIALTGNTRTSLSFLTTAKKNADVYLVKAGNAMIRRPDAAVAGGKVGFDSVGAASVMGSYIVVNADNTYRWESRTWEDAGTGITATVKISRYVEQIGYVLKDFMMTFDFLAGKDTESNPLGTIYKAGFEWLMVGGAFQLAYMDKSNDNHPESQVTVSMPAAEGSSVYLIIEDGIFTTSQKLDAVYADGNLSVDLIQEGMTTNEIYDNILMPLFQRSKGKAPSPDAPAGYLLVTTNNNLKFARMPHASDSGRNTSLTYTGLEQSLIPGENCMVEGTTAATDVGTYSATATPDEGYVWPDGSTKTIKLDWSISKAELYAAYIGEKINPGGTPMLKVLVDPARFVNGETAETAKDLVYPTVTAPSVLEPGQRYRLTPEGGSAANYKFARYSPNYLYVNPEKPQAVSGLIYNGTEQTGVEEKAGYTLSGTIKATAAGEYTATATLGSGFTWPDGSKAPIEIKWSIAKAELTATYKGETIASDGTPALTVEVTGFVNGETAETATGYTAPTVTVPEALEDGKSYELTPTGGEAANYEFFYVAGTLKVGDVPEPDDAKLEPGTYTITANPIIPGSENVVIAGLTVYLASNSFPPASPAEHNAKLVVGSDGKLTLTISLMNPASEIFTLQNIESGPGIKVLETKRGGGPYGEGVPDRIQEFTVELENWSGEYQFTNCKEYPTILSQFKEMPIILEVDFDSADKKYAEPGEEQPTWTKTYTDETTGTAVTVTTTEESIGAKLEGASLSVTKTVEGERYDVLQQVLNEMYSTSPVFDLYSLVLGNDGEEIALTGNTKVFISFPTTAKTNAHVYLINADNRMKDMWNTAVAGGKVSFNKVGDASVMGSYVVLNADTTYKWESKTWEDADTGITATVKISYYAVKNDPSLTKPYMGFRFLAGKEAESNPLGTIYKTGFGSILGGDIQIAYVDASNGNHLESQITITVPAVGDSSVYLVTDNGTSKTAEKLDAVYADGKLSVDLYQEGSTAGELYHNILQPLYQGGAGAEPTPGAPIGYLLVSSNKDLKLASMPQLRTDHPKVTFFTYTGLEQSLIPGENCTVEGTTAATDAGDYTATATPNEGYVWPDGGTEAIEIDWSISKAKLIARYVSEKINVSDTPALKVSSSGFVNGETEETAKEFISPTVTAPEKLEPGQKYRLTPQGGSAANYVFSNYSGRDLFVNPEEPQAVTGLIYNGTEQTGVEEKAGYTLSGTTKTTAAGEYSATATLQPSFTWPDGGTDPIEITWSIAKAELTAAYKGETIAYNGTPELAVEVTGFVNGETAETATGYVVPVVTAPATIEAGRTYALTPAGGEAANYQFKYVAGNLVIAGGAPEEDIEITGFEAVTLDAGTAGSATYADAAAVIAALPGSVTAQAAGGTVSVPVTGWTDTDSYDPDTAGSYTFTATLGDIPGGYANPNNLTATAEVVIAAVSEPDPDKEPVDTIDADEQGEAEIGRDDLRGIHDDENIGFNFGDVTVNIPVRCLNNALDQDAGGTGSVKLQKKEASQADREQVLSIIADNDNLVGAIELNLKVGDMAISDLGGTIKITITLTDQQAAALRQSRSMKLCYYNPITERLEDMHAVFDLDNKTVTFYTDHLSTYVVVGTKSQSSSSSGKGSSTASYTIKAEAGEGGSISPSGNVKVDKGKDKTFTIKADAGYKIKDILVDGKSEGAVETYTFEEVAKTHTIKATFERTGEEGEGETAPDKATTGDTSIVFADTTNHWAQKAVGYVVSKGIFNGTGDDKFSPGAAMTRGMFVTTLGRMQNINPDNYSQSAFADVGQSKYYAPYVAWAAENGIAKGLSSSTFGPEQTITREQAAAMFANYLNFAGITPGQKNEAASFFADEDKISGWARENVYAMQRTGIIQGDAANNFNPQNPINRAEAAVIIARSLGFKD